MLQPLAIKTDGQRSEIQKMARQVSKREVFQSPKVHLQMSKCQITVIPYIKTFAHFENTARVTSRSPLILKFARLCRKILTQLVY